MRTRTVPPVRPIVDSDVRLVRRGQLAARAVDLLAAGVAQVVGTPAAFSRRTNSSCTWGSDEVQTEPGVG